ncbi:MAG: DUF3102 domain-containing protein [Planctomycetota bacterium]|jgi:hypothetical protein
MKKKTKAERLQEELNKAKSYHLKFQEAEREAHKQAMLAIEYAVKCGQALNQCKKLKPHGEWKDWVVENFNKSYETAVNYMRVANEWELDYIQAGIESGLINVSINSILSAIRQHKKNRESKTDQLKWMTSQQREAYLAENAFKDDMRKIIRFRIAKELSDMNFEDWPIEKLYILDCDLKGTVSYGIWDMFKNKLNEVVEREVEKEDIYDDLKYMLNYWKQVVKTENSQLSESA